VGSSAAFADSFFSVESDSSRRLSTKAASSCSSFFRMWSHYGTGHFPWKVHFWAWTMQRLTISVQVRHDDFGLSLHFLVCSKYFFTFPQFDEVHPLHVAACLIKATCDSISSSRCLKRVALLPFSFFNSMGLIPFGASSVNNARMLIEASSGLLRACIKTPCNLEKLCTLESTPYQPY